VGVFGLGGIASQGRPALGLALQVPCSPVLGSLGEGASFVTFLAQRQNMPLSAAVWVSRGYPGVKRSRHTARWSALASLPKALQLASAELALKRWYAGGSSAVPVAHRCDCSPTRYLSTSHTRRYAEGVRCRGTR
jgi:hypothetical protein